MAAYSGGLALMAETAHNLSDLAALATVWIGLTLSQRKSHSFPYGLYKVENVAAIVVGLFIFLTAYEIAKEALLESNREVVTHPAILLGVVIAACLGSLAATSSALRRPLIRRASWPTPRNFRPMCCLKSAPKSRSSNAS
jgi:divalent metal cation (Fe/Co/Zn/Cd) transporter